MSKPQVQIEKNIPLPKKWTSEKDYPILDMKVGDSFVYEGPRLLLANCITSLNALNSAYNFSMKMIQGEKGKWRCFRFAPKE